MYHQVGLDVRSGLAESHGKAAAAFFDGGNRRAGLNFNALFF